ncbi:unnamed protein product [Rotaria sp. Silwood1]|nr:unnamed protein product [Rotaria sp. Silwood1]CAF3406646.1 unnamed protein product [Rotaria sp. Silwood1]CAF3422509.1 unnamed protein product [Rotaria sp. Silwood1]CAF3426797.1 unnamed protein product [Rotaria sp. Silwood1]
MVTFCDEDKTCSCCGKSSSQKEIMSYTTFGQPDLDLRPPPMKRDTMFAWIEYCSHCGYCSHNINDEKGVSRKEIIQSSDYQAQLSSNDYPSLANQFLCYSILLEHEKNLVEAAWQALRAAWTCDDAHNEQGAVRSRLRAAKLIDDSRSANVEFSKQLGLDRCIEADALRRAGELQRAKELLQHMQGEEEEIIKTLYQFQLHLIESNDTRCYTITDAQKYHDANKQ